MADQKVSDLPSLNGADVDAADLLYIIDSSAGSAGSKKITVGQYQLAPVLRHWNLRDTIKRTGPLTRFILGHP